MMRIGVKIANLMSESNDQIPFLLCTHFSGHCACGFGQDVDLHGEGRPADKLRRTSRNGGDVQSIT